MNLKLLNHVEYAYELVDGEEADYLIIEFTNVMFSMNQSCLIIGALKCVLKLNFLLVMAHVKSSCEDYAKALIHELEVRFSNHELAWV
jgi:hypothetical protein